MSLDNLGIPGWIILGLAIALIMNWTTDSLYWIRHKEEPKDGCCPTFLPALFIVLSLACLHG